MSLEKKYTFSDVQFRLFQKLIMDLTSIKIVDQKKELIYGRLAKRLRALKLNDFDEYYNFLKNSHHAEDEHFINVVTTNLTSFFREVHHFEHMTSIAIPQMIKEKSDTKRIRVWSAGCSTGEEPYSIAMTLMEAIPDIKYWDVKILATDIDTDVILKATQGIYKDKEININKEQKEKWFKKGSGKNDGYVKISPVLQNLITFKQLNLLSSWPVSGPFDIILCRNVVIYFDKKTQKTLFKKFSNVVSSSGYIYIGHSETLQDVSGEFELLGKTTYQKIHKELSNEVI